MKLIHHVLDVDASPGRLWSALTEREGLAGWWSTEVDCPPAAVGTVVRFTFAGDFNPQMEVTELVDGERLVWRCVGGHQNWDDGTFLFELAPRPNGRSRLRFSQEYAIELSDDDYGIYNFNWGYYLESLRLLCVTGAGKPFSPDGH
jgi:uncharacterized protein YndB with AHSA1/START domain